MTNKITGWDSINAFGSIIAVSGRKYHWKIHMIHVPSYTVHIGIIEDDKCEVTMQSLLVVAMMAFIPMEKYLPR